MLLTRIVRSSHGLDDSDFFDSSLIGTLDWVGTKKNGSKAGRNWSIGSIQFISVWAFGQVISIMFKAIARVHQLVHVKSDFNNSNLNLVWVKIETAKFAIWKDTQNLINTFDSITTKISWWDNPIYNSNLGSMFGKFYPLKLHTKIIIIWFFGYLKVSINYGLTIFL